MSRKVSLSSVFMVIAVIVVLTACGGGPEKKINEFAERFALFVNTGKTDSIKSYYPDIVLADSLNSSIISDDIKIEMAQPAGYWHIGYGSQASIEVLLSEDGKITVKESRGLFAYPERIVGLAKEKNIWNPKETDAHQAEKIREMMEEWRKFSSADLLFLNLHAPVKNMQISYSDTIPNIFGDFWGWSGNYEFDEYGKIKDVANIKLDADHSLKGIERNPDGDIGRLFFAPSDTWDGEADYLWEEGMLKGSQTHFGSHQALFTYHPDGVLQQISYRYGNTEGDNGADVVLSDYVFDEAGNWISCKWTMQRVEPVPYYSVITGALVGYKDRVSSTREGTITRKIEYKWSGNPS